LVLLSVSPLLSALPLNLLLPHADLNPTPNFH
jgi:hypothetical protein